MNVFDWLSNMDIPTFQRFDVVEIKFKGGRKEYFRNPNKLELFSGDAVVVEVSNGHHIGFVSLQGELVRLQMLKKSIQNNEEIKAIYRKATPKDMEKHEQAIARDYTAMYRSRELIKEHKLNMKLSDVEFQSDNSKATFYYSADERVDFRDLIKTLAGEFKVRVEMKQISLRQEAGRLGGIGVCGRELCCSTWLTDFKNVTTSAARYQNLSLNPVKLSGQCGRLKCCLNYELETYMDALKGIPQIEQPLLTEKGKAVLQKTDIFKRIMWFGYVGEESTWLPVAVDRVVEVIELNKKGILPQSFEILDIKPLISDKIAGPLNAELDRLDKKYSSGSGNKKKGNFNKPAFEKREQKSFEAKPQAENQPRPEPKPQQIKPEAKVPTQPNADANNPQQPKPQGQGGNFKKKNFKKYPPRGNKPPEQ